MFDITQAAQLVVQGFLLLRQQTPVAQQLMSPKIVSTLHKGVYVQEPEMQPRLWNSFRMVRNHLSWTQSHTTCVAETVANYVSGIMGVKSMTVAVVVTATAGVV